jgi:hypothetical protein
MAGKVVVSTLNNDTGVLATQNGMTGIAKAWVNFAGASGSVNGSFNVGSVTRNSTGDYTVNFTTAMPNANYVAFSYITNAGSASQQMGTVGSQLTTSFRFTTVNPGVAFVDPTTVMVGILGS